MFDSCGKMNGIMKWVLATQSFATDLLYILAVAMSSSATIAAIATNHVRGCEDQHRNRWLGRLRRLRFELRNRSSCRNRPSPFGCDAPFATVAAVATRQLWQRWIIWNYLKGRRCKFNFFVSHGKFPELIQYLFCRNYHGKQPWCPCFVILCMKPCGLPRGIARRGRSAGKKGGCVHSFRHLQK